MPQIQMLPGAPNFLTSALGGFSEGLTSLMKSLPERQALQAYNQSLYGQKPAVSAPLDSLAPDGEGSFSPTAPPAQSMAEGMASTAVQGKSSQAAPRSQYKVAPVIASQQVPPPVKANQIPQHATAVQSARTRSDALTKTYREGAEGKAAKARELTPLLNRGEQLVKKSKNVEGFRGYLQAEAGKKFPFLKSADVKELQRIGKEVITGNFRERFGGRPAASEFFYIEDVYFKPGDPKESILRGIKLEKEMNKIDLKRDDIINDLLSTYGEYPINLNAMVEERMTPYYRQMMKNIGYDEWADKQKSKVTSINEGKERLKVYDSAGKHVGSIESNEIGQLPSGYTAK